MTKKKDKSPNSKYYSTKAEDLFMPQFRVEPCEICETTVNTCGHHIISKARSKALRFDKRNIIILCPAHHTMGTDMAPHATSQTAVERYIEWFKENKPEQYAWTKENEYIQRRYTYKHAAENMAQGLAAWA